MQINPHSIPPLLSSIIIFVFGTYILSRQPKSPTNRSFFLFCLSTTTWLFFYAINFTTSYFDMGLTSLIYKIGYCGVAFIGITFFHFFVIFYDAKMLHKAIIANYILGTITSFLIFKTNWIIDGLHIYFWGYYPKAGPAHPIFLIYFLSLCGIANCLSFETLRSKTASEQRKNQAKYLFISFSIFTLACLDFVPNYGIELYPAGYIYATLFIIIVGYAAIKHNFLEVNIAIKKGLIYSLLIAAITVLYLILVILFEKAFQGIFQYNAPIASVSTTIIIALIFIPLKERIQKLIDKIFLKGSPIEIAEENAYLRKEIADKEKFHAIATLASGVAHEIKNPLTAIKTFFEYLPEKKNDPEFLNKLNRVVGTEIDRVDRLVHQLLEFAKPSPLHLQVVDINTLLEDALDLLSSEIHKKNIAVTKNLNTLPRMQADSNKLKQAFINIMLNAIEAMSQEGELRVITRLPGNNTIEISIQDTGPGIAPNDLPHIFDPFYSKKEKGTGLGLAITKGIIEEHRGTIAVKRNSPTGTNMILKFPKEQEIANT